MKRDLRWFENNSYDVIVIGGGVYGAFVLWEAALRGLSVALFEKGDFGGATSANSLKVIHGGLRYLQRGDITRFRTSIQERNTLLAIAPHLVAPLPVVIPAYGHGMLGREAMQIAATMSNIICRDILDTCAKDVRLPGSRFVSRGECLELFPDLPDDGLTGGLLTYDAQAMNPERLVLSVIQSAVFRGAHVANYAEVTGCLWRGNTVKGVTVRDRLSGDSLSVTGNMVINTAGPWVNTLLEKAGLQVANGLPGYTKAVNLVVRNFLADHALGVKAQRKAGSKPTNSAQRMFFAAPWRETSLIGTAYFKAETDPDRVAVTEVDISALLDSFNRAYPAAGLTRDDVRLVHVGLVPTERSSNTAFEPTPAKQHTFRDHRLDGVFGIISIIGEKFTTARHVAEQVVDTVIRLWEKEPSPSRSAMTPLHDGRIENFPQFVELERKTLTCCFSADSIQMLAHDYGTAIGRVLAYYSDLGVVRSDDLARIDLLKARIRYAVIEESAVHLSDVVFRRTGLGTVGFPGDYLMNICALEMADLIGWDEARAQNEIANVQQDYANKGSHVVRIDTAPAGTPVHTLDS